MTLHISRRDFIRVGALSSLAVVSGNPVAAMPEHSTPSPAPINAGSETKVAMVRARDGLEAVNRAIEIAGGLDFIRPGDSVLVKPAMNSSEPFPATTDPEVVSLVVELCAGRGASRVAVADKPFFLKKAATVFERSGIGPAARRAGADVIPLDEGTWMTTRQPAAEHWGGEFRIPTVVKEFDHIIYLPTVRTHKIARFTMSLKNSVGLLAPMNCMLMHVSRSLPERIAEINLAVRPSFYVLDGRKVFVDGGPDTGLQREPGIVFAGTDPVACDALGVALLKALGTREDVQRSSVWEQRTIKRAAEVGLGVDSAQKIDIAAEGVEEQEEIVRNLA